MSFFLKNTEVVCCHYAAAVCLHDSKSRKKIEKRGLINTGWRRWLRLSWPGLTWMRGKIEKEGWLCVPDHVWVCRWGWWKRRPETREPEEPEQISAWVGEKCDMLPTNGVAASHTPGRHGSSAAANRGLDMIFSSAVSSARPLSLIFACLESWSRMLHTECSWHADLWWVQIQVCAFFSFGWRFRQDVLAFLIRFLTPLLSTSMITKATSCQGFK